MGSQRKRGGKRKRGRGDEKEKKRGYIYIFFLYVCIYAHMLTYKENMFKKDDKKGKTWKTRKHGNERT